MEHLENRPPTREFDDIDSLIGQLETRFQEDVMLPNLRPDRSLDHACATLTCANRCTAYCTVSCHCR